MKIFDYEFWKDLAAVMSYATVGFSILGKETFGNFYSQLITSAIILIFFCIIQMILHKLDKKIKIDKRFFENHT
jgi:hypothetical protein